VQPCRFGWASRLGEHRPLLPHPPHGTPAPSHSPPGTLCIRQRARVVLLPRSRHEARIDAPPGELSESAGLTSDGGDLSRAVSLRYAYTDKYKSRICFPHGSRSPRTELACAISLPIQVQVQGAMHMPASAFSFHRRRRCFPSWKRGAGVFLQSRCTRWSTWEWISVHDVIGTTGPPCRQESVSY
jgi:hypothetical protein